MILVICFDRCPHLVCVDIFPSCQFIYVGISLYFCLNFLQRKMGGKESKNSLQPQLLGATYLWEVEGYLDIPLSEPMFSSHFEVFGDSFRLGLHKGSNLEIKLHQKRESDMRKKFKCVSSFLDHTGLQYYSQTKEVEIVKGTYNIVLLSIPQTLLGNETCYVTLMNRFYVSFKISAIFDVSESPAVDTNSATETLSSDLGKLYSNQFDSDVEIHTNTGQCFKAHRLILSARSPVFAAMFRHDTSERLKGTVNINDVEVPTLASLLHYIYMGRVQGLNSNTATHLIKVADKYDLQDLKDASSEFLLSNLTMDNIYDAVVLAEMCDIPSLKKEVQAFMCKHRAEVIKSEEWKKLQAQYPDLVNSVLTTLLISTQEEAK